MNTDRSVLVEKIARALLNEREDEARQVVVSEYAFSATPSVARRYTEAEKMQVYLRDGFIDRYTGQRLVFAGMLRLISHALPDEFPFHPNWKMSECHPAYWELSPTLDHVQPVARGGSDDISNWVTVSMLTNARKANWTLEELGWQLLPPGDSGSWDGLTRLFLNLVEADPAHLNVPALRSWHKIAVQALKP